ncbi:Hypothetical protein YALI2_E00650g [Yarrowia lipolytica]|nr:Hypothetical protein YALI2_E00650g [Yarrowia lipolytica]
MDRPNNEDSLLTATLAGVTAGLVQSSLTYPFEFMKTSLQLRRNLPGAAAWVPPDFGKVYFTGLSAVAIGAATKAVVRVSTFTAFSKFMADEDNRTTAPRVVTAGLLTGITESFIVVPFESIKTTMINRVQVAAGKPVAVPPTEIKLPEKPETAAKGPVETAPVTIKDKKRVARPTGTIKPPTVHYGQIDTSVSGLLGNIKEMYKDRGIRAFVQGFFPTVTRQAANSAVRFTTYSALKHWLTNPEDSEYGRLSAVWGFGLGLLSSGAMVLATQPIDVVKTRLQSIHGIKEYRSSLQCAYKIFVEEGVMTFWAGTLPRFCKAGLSGAIIFGTYESVSNVLNAASQKKPFPPGEE